MLRYNINEPGVVLVRQTYNGIWERSLIRNKHGMPKEMVLKPLYHSALALPPAKKSCLESLVQYLKRPGSKEFYNKLLNSHNQTANNEDDIEEDDNGTSDIE